MGFEGETIISGQCPSGYCCQYEECEYVDDSDALCAMFRDTDSLLCSECIEGYSESVNSPQCVKCGKSVYWNFMFLPVSMAVLLSVFILFTNSEKDIIPKPKPQKEDHDEMSDDEVAGKVATVPALKRRTLTGLMLANAKSDSTKLMLASLAKIAIYYEQVRWCLEWCHDLCHDACFVGKKVFSLLL